MTQSMAPTIFYSKVVYCIEVAVSSSILLLFFFEFKVLYRLISLKYLSF